MAHTRTVLKSYLAGLNLSGLGAGQIVGDQAPPAMTLPYLSIHEGIATVPDGMEDGGADTVSEMVQVSLWERWRSDTDDSDSESGTLGDALLKGLHGATLSSIDSKVVYAVQVVSSRRLSDPDVNIVQRAYTLLVRRQT